jgi:hypothetical protein
MVVVSLFSMISTLSEYPLKIILGSNPITDVSAKTSGPDRDSKRNE